MKTSPISIKTQQYAVDFIDFRWNSFIYRQKLLDRLWMRSDSRQDLYLILIVAFNIYFHTIFLLRKLRYEIKFLKLRQYDTFSWNEWRLHRRKAHITPSFLPCYPTNMPPARTSVTKQQNVLFANFFRSKSQNKLRRLWFNLWCNRLNGLENGMLSLLKWKLQSKKSWSQL